MCTLGGCLGFGKEEGRSEGTLDRQRALYIQRISRIQGLGTKNLRRELRNNYSPVFHLH